MGDILVQQGVTFHTTLRQKLQKNIDRLQQIKKFSINTCQLFIQFSNNINLTCEQLFQKLKIDQEQDQNIIFMSKYIIDILGQLSKKVNTVGISLFMYQVFQFLFKGNKVHNQIVEPMIEFVQNQTLTNKMLLRQYNKLLRQSQQIIYSLQSNNQFLKQLSKNYSINSKSKSKQQIQQFSLIYQMQMSKCNQKWQQIKVKCTDILSKIDSYNSSRCNFTTKQQISLIKMINLLVMNNNVQQSLTQYQQIMEQSSSLSQQIKDSIRQKIGRVNLLEDRKIQIQLDSLDNSNTDNQSNIKHSRQKKVIDDFVSIFTSKTPMKTQQSKDFQQARSLVLDKQQWIKYFLTKMQSSLHTQINLPIVKYRELTALIKYIFAHAAQLQAQDQSMLYSVLYISYRIKYNDECLMKDIGKQQDFWKNTKIWFRIIQYVKKSKYSYKQVNLNNTPQKLSGPSSYIKYGKMLTKQLWAIRPRNKQKAQKNLQIQSQLKTQKILLDARDYDIMCQMCYFMIKLQLQQKFVFNFILEASQKYHFSQQNIKKLIKIHSFNRISQNNKIGSTQVKRKKRLQKKYNSLSNIQDKLCISVGKSLIFLSIKTDNIVNLRLVSKHWAQTLPRRIFQRYLIHEITLNFNARLILYKQICHPPYKQQVYRRMVKQMPQSCQHTQIIFLDAKRSLSWNEGLRMSLMQVLGVYAFYHPHVGYLQGMNYLCENILKMTKNTYQVYSIFEYLMNYHYNNMYTGKFDGLKIKIYQMMRILQRQNTKLYNHFQSEKIQGEHFLLSWAITLWGQMNGDICWILWDGFIIKGWKWWIKTCLWLLKILQAQLLKMNFQQIMKCFSDLTNSLFSMNFNQLNAFGIDKDKIKQEIDKIHIESDILKDIQKQYEMKINNVNEVLKKLDKKNK